MPPPPPKDPHVTATFVAVNVLELLATLVVNILLFVAVYKFHTLRTLANAFLVSLAVVDLLFVVTFASNIVHHLSKTDAPALCFISAELSHALTCLVVLHLMAIAIDRLLAITLHLRYRQVVTRRRVTIAIVAIWIFGIIEASLPTMLLSGAKEQAHDAHKMQQGCLSSGKFSDEWTRDAKRFIVIEKVVAIAVPYVVILLCYVWIFKIAWRHHRQIKNERTRTNEHDGITKVEMKAAKTTAIIIGSFVVTFTPLLLVSVGRVLKKPSKHSPKDVQTFICVVIPSLKALAATCAFLNPPIYACRNKPFREAFGVILKPFCSLFPCCSGSCVSREIEQNEYELRSTTS